MVLTFIFHRLKIALNIKGFIGKSKDKMLSRHNRNIQSALMSSMNGQHWNRAEKSSQLRHIYCLQNEEGNRYPVLLNL
jgi:hypothetical protein